MFTIEDDHIMAAFLHPNYKQLRNATSAQISDCHATCRLFLLPDSSIISCFDDDDECDEPPVKKSKSFISSLMDKSCTQNQSSADEVDRYVHLQIDDDAQYVDPLSFWKQKEQQIAFPNLTRLATRCFAIPCSSAAVERQFSVAGQIITQRRSNLDPSTVNNIIFLRSIENNLNL
jgi:hAT family C-terminal dimerisation region